MPLPLFEVKKMNEKRYQKNLEFQKNIISRQSDKIESLKSEIEDLKLKCEEKDELIKSVDFLRSELIKDTDEIKKHKKEYEKLINELRKMKDVLNKEVYNGKWNLVKFFIK